MFVFNRLLRAHRHAVAAGHAPRIIDEAVLAVDAGGLAVLGAETAFHAFLFVNVHLEPGEPAKETQEGAHGADVVAVGASVAPRENDDDHEGHCRDDEGGQTAHPHLFAVEGVAVEMLAEGG